MTQNYTFAILETRILKLAANQRHLELVGQRQPARQARQPRRPAAPATAAAQSQQLHPAHAHVQAHG